MLATVCPGPGRFSETVTPRVDIAGARKGKKFYGIARDFLLRVNVRNNLKQKHMYSA
jgi:hypothetical protein